MTLFAVLPFGVVSQEESGEVVPGSEASAPARPLMAKKFSVTTGVALLIYVAIYWLLTSDFLVNTEIPFLPDFTKRG